MVILERPPGLPCLHLDFKGHTQVDGPFHALLDNQGNLYGVGIGIGVGIRIRIRIRTWNSNDLA